MKHHPRIFAFPLFFFIALLLSSSSLQAQEDKKPSATAMASTFESLQADFQAKEAFLLKEFMELVRAEPLMQQGKRYAEIHQASEKGNQRPASVTEAEWNTYQRLSEAYFTRLQALRDAKTAAIKESMGFQAYCQTRKELID